jgi:CRP/FNR family cyclic AMP-dependent transcriptional regulator
VSDNDDMPGYRIWAADDVVYGPVELPQLVEWIQDERVEGDTWIYIEHEGKWQQAGKVPDFGMFFRKRAPAGGAEAKEKAPLIAGIKPGMLRRVKILSEFDDTQLGRFLKFMEVKQVRQFVEIVKQGEHGDSMFLVLEGEVRVRLMIGNKERILVTMPPGEFFGEMAPFDQSPRSADIVANTDCTLLKISVEAIESLRDDAPDLAARFFMAMCKTFSARIRADNKRFRDTLNFGNAASGVAGS